MKHKFIKVFAFCILMTVLCTLPSAVCAVSDTTQTENSTTSTQTPQQTTKSFLVIILGGACLSCAVYIGLNLWKKYKNSANSGFDEIINAKNNDNYSTPKDLNSAIVRFLTKVK